MTERGTLIDHDGRPAVRFRRELAQPAERVWAAITDPGDLARWFPSQVRMEQKVGGTIEFYGDPNQPEVRSTGTILVYEPPARLAYTWLTSELHFMIEPSAGGGCVLTLTDVLEARDTAARNAAGWAVCLAELDKHLAGIAASGPHSDTAESWRRHYEDYVAAGLPSGAWVPGGASGPGLLSVPRASLSHVPPADREPGPRYDDLIDALLEEPGVTPPHGGGFGRSACRFNGKIFVMFVRGRLVLKLPEKRVDQLIAAGLGTRFDANKGTPMREWLSLDPDSDQPWLPLAREALGFARSAPAAS